MDSGNPGPGHCHCIEYDYLPAGFQLGHFPEQTVQSEFYHRKVSGSAGQRGKDSRLLRSDHGREPEKRHGFSDAVPCAGRI